MAKKPQPIRAIYTGTSAQLEGLNRRFSSSRLVINTTTGEIRKGPGKWSEMQPWPTESADNGGIIDALIITSNVADIASTLVDGATLINHIVTTGSLVLLTGQTDPEENGVYVVGEEEGARHPDFPDLASHLGQIFSGVMAGGGDTKVMLVDGSNGFTWVSFWALGNLRLDRKKQIENLLPAAEPSGSMLLLVEDTDGQLKQMSIQDLASLIQEIIEA